MSIRVKSNCFQYHGSSCSISSIDLGRSKSELPGFYLSPIRLIVLFHSVCKFPRETPIVISKYQLNVPAMLQYLQCVWISPDKAYACQITPETDVAFVRHGLYGDYVTILLTQRSLDYVQYVGSKQLHGYKRWLFTVAARIFHSSIVHFLYQKSIACLLSLRKKGSAAR